MIKYLLNSDRDTLCWDGDNGAHEMTGTIVLIVLN